MRIGGNNFVITMHEIFNLLCVSGITEDINLHRYLHRTPLCFARVLSRVTIQSFKRPMERDERMKPYKTMTEAMEGLKQRGFTANFEFLNNTFRAVGGGKTFAPDELTIVEHHRFEGASDPDDLSVLYAIEANDGTRGAVVDAFGPYANPDLGAFLKGVKMRERL